ncbi:GNAT family N-acetyltransferase [Actinacidiphila soli]|uniref:GNAT family N-acetyltransferase n=1 Tax=Actinacidiphila soli TaxID=2487275 RepID=UPI000FCC1788|nr:GNAT family N-acetyltransferase [Actinacidiphila soli]
MPIRLTPLTHPDRLVWLAADPAGHPVGSAFLRLFDRPGQDHLAELELAVHPADRRHGTGTQLLTAAITAAREAGKRCVIAQAVADSPGAHFLPGHGFRRVLTLTYARLALAEADIAALTAAVARPHPGYHLVSWDGTVPDHLAQTYADSRHAMDDMPMDDTDFGTVTWDIPRLRAVAQAVADRGDHLHTVAALHQPTDAIVAFTELVVPGDGTGDAQHYGTAVLPAHRGHGLAAWLKAQSILHARTHHPALTGLLTDTADSNTYMRRINDALGYAPTHRTITYQLDL